MLGLTLSNIDQGTIKFEGSILFFIVFFVQITKKVSYITRPKDSGEYGHHSEGADDENEDDFPDEFPVHVVSFAGSLWLFLSGNSSEKVIITAKTNAMDRRPACGLVNQVTSSPGLGPAFIICSFS